MLRPLVDSPDKHGTFMKPFLTLLLFAFASQLRAAPVELHYGERRLDLEAFVGIGGDYMVRAMASAKDGSLYALMNTAEGPKLVRFPYANGTWSEANSEVVYDFGKRALWTPFYDRETDSFYLNSDVQNDETFNYYRFDPTANSLTQITHSGYAPAASISQSRELIYLGRPVKTGPDHCLGAVGLASSVESRLWCDSPENRVYVYENPAPSPDSQKIAFVLMTGDLRSKLHLVVLDRATGKIDTLTDAAIERSQLKPLGWRGNEILALVGDKDQTPKVYAFDVANGARRLVLDSDRPVVNAAYDKGSDRILADQRTSDDSQARLLSFSVADGSRVETDSSGYLLWWSSICSRSPMVRSPFPRKSVMAPVTSRRASIRGPRTAHHSCRLACAMR